MRGLMHLAGGSRGRTLDLDAFLEQSEAYRSEGGLLDSVYKVLNLLGATHPFAVVRVAELRDWIDSGAYERIVSGDYPHRDEADERAYREDLAEAMKGYKESARDLMDQVDAAVDKVRSRFMDAWRGEPPANGS